MDKSYDPKGLIKDSFRIEGITIEECRSVFVDWALSLESEVDVRGALNALSEHYGSDIQKHPMLDVLSEGMAEPAVKGRRGGWAGRRAGRE